jgi:hypothetical protein
MNTVDKSRAKNRIFIPLFLPHYGYSYWSFLQFSSVSVSTLKYVAGAIFQNPLLLIIHDHLLMISDVQSLSSRAKEITCGYSMQDGAITHTNNYSSDVLGWGHTSAHVAPALRDVFDNRMISCRLWPATSPDLNPWEVYLWGNLNNEV